MRTSDVRGSRTWLGPIYNGKSHAAVRLIPLVNVHLFDIFSNAGKLGRNVVDFVVGICFLSNRAIGIVKQQPYSEYIGNCKNAILPIDHLSRGVRMVLGLPRCRGLVSCPAYATRNVQVCTQQFQRAESVCR